MKQYLTLPTEDDAGVSEDVLGEETAHTRAHTHTFISHYYEDDDNMIVSSSCVVSHKQQVATDDVYMLSGFYFCLS